MKKKNREELEYTIGQAKKIGWCMIAFALGILTFYLANL
jgi:hypothetical protein